MLWLHLNIPTTVNYVDKRISREGEALAPDSLALIGRNADIIRTLKVFGNPGQ